jgi:hypothetical protein
MPSTASADGLAIRNRLSTSWLQKRALKHPVRAGERMQSEAHAPLVVRLAGRCGRYCRPRHHPQAHTCSSADGLWLYQLGAALHQASRTPRTQLVQVTEACRLQPDGEGVEAVSPCTNHHVQRIAASTVVGSRSRGARSNRMPRVRGTRSALA